MLLGKGGCTLDDASRQSARAVEVEALYPSIHGVVKARWFDILNTILYFVNIFLLIWRTYVDDELHVALFIAETAVITLQCVELGLRFAGSRGLDSQFWLSDYMNIFDTVVLVGFLGVAGSVVLPLTGVRGLVKLRRFQIMRIFRLGNLVKSFRTQPVFKPLHIILNGIKSSYATIAFTFALVTLVLYFFAVLYVIVLKDSSNANAVRYFGSVAKAFYTMFQILTTESWNEMMRPVYIDHPGTVVITTVFIGVTKYLILSLVTALILEAAMSTVKNDEETLAAKHRAERMRIAKELTFLFQSELGGDQAAEVITKEEFESLVEIPTIRTRLQQLGWYKTDLIDLWELLDAEGSCVLEIQPIVYNIHKLRGKARTKDLLFGLKEASRALRVMDEFVDRLGSSVNAIARAKDSLARVQGGAKKIIQGVEKLKIAIAARERVQGRFKGISEITSNSK